MNTVEYRVVVDGVEAASRRYTAERYYDALALAVRHQEHGHLAWLERREFTAWVRVDLSTGLGVE